MFRIQMIQKEKEMFALGRLIELQDCPEKLQDAVKSYLENSKGAEVISVQKWSDAPYTDKTITRDRFLVFTENINYYSVFQIAVCSKPEWSDEEVSVSGMLAAKIIELVKHSEFLKYGVMRELSM